VRLGRDDPRWRRCGTPMKNKEIEDLIDVYYSIFCQTFKNGSVGMMT
jgi:hypothetical protein